MRASQTRDLLVPTYAVGVFGAFLQMAGGNWDISWHILGLVESFFTVPHAILYTGIGLCLMASLVGVGLRRTVLEPALVKVSNGFLVSLVGSAMQLIAGPFDFWWHSVNGFDPFLFTPAHSLLIIGGILTGSGMAMGAIRLFQAHRAGIALGKFLCSARSLRIVAMVGLATLWLNLNLLVYFLTDEAGMAYTFGLCSQEAILSIPNQCPFVDQTEIGTSMLMFFGLAASGTLVFYSGKSLIREKGVISLSALLSGIVLALSYLAFQSYAFLVMFPPGSIILQNATAEIGYTIASFMPFYFALIVPVFLFDRFVDDSTSRKRAIVACTALGPFASYLGAPLAWQLWVFFQDLILPVTLFMLLGGLLAALSHTRFSKLFVAAKATLSH